MQKKHNQSGFTLLEVTLALILFSILFVSVFMMFEDSYTSYIGFQNKTNVLEDSRMITEFIQEEVRAADYVKLDITVGSGVVAAPPLTPHYDYLTKITLKKEEVLTPTGPKQTGRTILVLHIDRELNSPDMYIVPGNEISYQGVIIADNVKNIVIKELNNPYSLEIDCTVKDKIGTSAEEVLTSKLLIELEYKKSP